MKRPTTWMLPIALLLVVATPVYLAEPGNGQEAGEDAPAKADSQIAKWISQLESDEFKVREQAEEALTKAGLKALPAVLKATQSKRPEVRVRAFEIFFALSKSDDQALGNAVLRAAKEILQSEDRRRVVQAKRILEYRNTRAVQMLLKLGARFDKPNSIPLLLSGSPVTDKQMAHLKWLTGLRYLWLDNTKVTDAGLEHLKGLTKLEELHLSHTKVTDAGLPQLKGMTKLSHLVLQYTEITDAGLEHLKGLKSLRYLNLTKTNVTDAGLKNLKGLTELRSLGLNGTKVDAGLEHLKGMTNLQRLSLDNTQVTDAGLKNLKGLTELQRLSLYNTQVTDVGLDHLKGLTNLRFLDLRATNVTDSGVKKLQQALPKCEKIYHSRR